MYYFFMFRNNYIPLGEKVMVFKDELDAIDDLFNHEAEMGMTVEQAWYNDDLELCTLHNVPESWSVVEKD